MQHSCSCPCLGPLTFHPQAVGDMIRLSEGLRCAERTEETFRGGVVFSNRPVSINERVRVLVQKKVPHWKGALRVGFTNVPPSARTLPLPCMAMPNLTNTQGHWACPVPESCCQEGSVLEFWVSPRGSLHYMANNDRKRTLAIKVDLSLPLWAMIDVYGQTCSIFLLGSEKKGTLFNRTSCPAPEPPIRISPDYNEPSENSDDSVSCSSKEIRAGFSCVVCLEQEAEIKLPCGHRCLCALCSARVLAQFGRCPLCREEINNIFYGGGDSLGAGWSLNLSPEALDANC
uniref:E3 ubiquitin-protein ligase NEURL3-like n=1 Tax=Fundulus heteroclitus TaxID=8078 RepID=A0A3Q2UN51_FUNHE